MNSVRRTMPEAGPRTFSTETSDSRVTKGFSTRRSAAWRRVPSEAAIRMTASQNGKNPLIGPLVPHPIPMRSESQTTRAPRSRSNVAVTRSAVRMTTLWEVDRRAAAVLPRGQGQPPRENGRSLPADEAALGHQLLVELFGPLEPLHELGPRQPGLLERPLLEEVLELGRGDDLLEHALVPLHRVLRHAGRPEDPAQHVVADVGAERFLHRRDVRPA